jgi:hypothetical protein
MPEETVRELVRYVRSSLRERGQLGAFLLSELESSISRGFEEAPILGKKLRNSEQASGRRSLDEAELLEVIGSVFETYLVTLPALAKSLASQLKDRDGIEQIEIVLDPSLLDDDLHEVGRTQLQAIIPSVPDDQVIQALKNIKFLASQPREGKN